jgi:hypothetical protein
VVACESVEPNFQTVLASGVKWELAFRGMLNFLVNALWLFANRKRSTGVVSFDFV